MVSITREDHKITISSTLLALKKAIIAHGRLPSSLSETKKWLGYQDSNLGMQGSKPCALPLGDTPTDET